jgi:hypothetical protein
MRKCLSSIFSFKTVSAIGPVPRAFVLTIAVALLLFAIAEGMSRAIVGTIGRRWEYWDDIAAVKFEDYRTRVSSNGGPDIVIIGDSTAARDLDPWLMAKDHLAGKEIYNLGWPANFPFAFRVTTLPLLREPYQAPRIVLASFAPQSFTDNPRVSEFEQDILKSIYCQHVLGNYSFADKFFLPRLRNAMPFIHDSFKPNEEFNELRKNRGFMPSAAIVEIYYTADSASHAAQIVGDRFDVLIELAELSRQRKFGLYILIPPVSPALATSTADVYQKYLALLKSAQQKYGFTLLDKRRTPFLTDEYFADGIHLTHAGADLFSLTLQSEFGSEATMAGR